MAKRTVLNRAGIYLIEVECKSEFGLAFCSQVRCIYLIEVECKSFFSSQSSNLCNGIYLIEVECKCL